MDNRTYPIDWRTQIAELQPYLDDKGGTITVSYHGRACGPSAFVTMLKSLFEGRWSKDGFDPKENEVRSSILIDSANYRVQYMPGLRSEFLRKLGVDPTSVGHKVQRSGDQIGTGNEAGGNQEINVEIHYHADTFREKDEFAAVITRDAWIADVIQRLDQFLSTGRFMVVLLAGPANDQREFWRDLWGAGMDRLVAKGLLLVHMIDHTIKKDASPVDTPRPDMTLRLSSELTKMERDHAIEDVSAWLQRRFDTCNLPTANAWAQSYVANHSHDLEALRGSVSGWMIQLGNLAAEAR